jgi:hypothetical protein
MTDPPEDRALERLGSLEQVTGPADPRLDGALARVSCVTLCHNERLIVGQFLDHYRSLGISQFYIVDDRSTDGTFEYLADQPDVALFRPVGEAQYKDNVGVWRQAILDRFCDGGWVCLPDLDEFLYVRDAAASLPQIAAAMEVSGEEALIGVMVDMYSEQPLMQGAYDGSVTLTQAFPFFDGQGVPPTGSRIVALPQSFTTRFPTPPVCFMGGVRERVFSDRKPLNAVQRALSARFSHMGRPMNPTWIEALQNRVTRTLTKSVLGDTQLVLNKFALLKWRAGTRFPRAPHFVDRKVTVSESIAAFLHYKFYKGVAGMEYSARREQHAGGAKVYKRIVSQRDVLERPWMSPATRRFEGVGSLSEIIR